MVDQEIQSLTEEFNTAVVDTAKEVLGKHRPVKKPWVTTNILKKCDKRRELKKLKKKSDKWIRRSIEK